MLRLLLALGNSGTSQSQSLGINAAEQLKRELSGISECRSRKAIVRPSGFLKMAERFELPLLLFIDTQGAFPGLEGEERGQAEAIANSLIILSGLRTPIISIVIGEGGSGGALALGICDRLLMLENSTYSVITPEGCAAILWGKDTSTDSKDGAGKAAENAKNAAESLQLTAQALNSFSIADEIVKEPTGGAHRDHALAAELVEAAIGRQLSALTALAKGELGKDELLKQRTKSLEILAR